MSSVIYYPCGAPCVPVSTTEETKYSNIVSKSHTRDGTGPLEEKAVYSLEFGDFFFSPLTVHSPIYSGSSKHSLFYWQLTLAISTTLTFQIFHSFIIFLFLWDLQ